MGAGATFGTVRRGMNEYRIDQAHGICTMWVCNARHAAGLAVRKGQERKGGSGKRK